MTWKRTAFGEWVSRPFFIRRAAGTYSLHLSDGSDFGKFIAGALPTLAEAKAIAETQRA